MTFKYSRHARRRIRLYDIDRQILQKRIVEHITINGKQIGTRITFIDPEQQIEGLPLKIVYVVETSRVISAPETITIVTVYPLIKGLKS